MSGSDCLCGGSGTIYDYSAKGDPCPECSDGFPAHLSSKVRFTADKVAGRSGRSCSVVIVLLVVDAMSVVSGVSHYV